MVNPVFPRKIGCCSSLLWLCCLIFATALMLFSIIYNLFMPEWFHQGNGEDRWEGDLLGVYNSGSIVINDSYGGVSDKMCERADDAATGLSEDKYNLLCSRFRDLSRVAVFFIVCSMTSLVGLAVLAGSVAISWLKEIRLNTMLGAGIFAFGSYLIGALAFVVYSYSTNDEEVCDRLFDVDGNDVELERACRDPGAVLLVLNMAFMTVYLVFIIMSYSLISREMRVAYYLVG